MFIGEDKDEVGIGDEDGVGGGGKIVSRLKECDITRNNILMMICKINPINFLHAQVADKHPFDRIGTNLDVLGV